ncbi:DUF4365 domain-containing protein [Salinimicrobium gaetbulicola]|uniref:DUF4365 domain-containing protein n=1 Tax=Salinimicrobium gaetbulicola TaxID=999702 RepID=A0ABW3IBR5_9FLAO
MRYNSKERLGINATESIFLKEFNWIFREQPIVDVGIDALVEQVNNGSPQGKFLALQIKSGEGNFRITADKLIYYLSNVHYNYWTNFDLPVILVGHIPEEDKTYWEELSIKKIKKTNKSWKLEISKRNLLNQKAKPFLQNLLTSKTKDSHSLKIFQGENIDNETIFELDSKLDCIGDANESTERTVELLYDLTAKIVSSHERIVEHTNKGDTINSPQVNNTLKKLSKDINISARRLENEILIYSGTIAEGIYAYEQAIIIHFFITKNPINLQEHLESLQFLPTAIDGAISGIQFMRSSFDNIPGNHADLKVARKNMIKVIDLIINEYEVSKNLIESLIEKINLRMN